ncbi:ATP-binding cassette domain-containing protein [Curtobacterium flaccumfaciens pv. oortii]|uniref:ABC transporter ATP-binding protein n=1 Tax=Curtobacterium flaccumfaciens TaxID=2035 RepID=UPI001BDF338F|nr:ATP-binding cassette domain-containing protein [Curtobacterium flaccumfaciens]MBT1623518.1 ATP-binding cassette domain-containing protein [Curtobacterium flaccumfaciens pv. oortii]
MTDQPILQVDGLGHDVATRTLWHDLAFTVGAGEVLAIRGASGQGKSTLLRCLGGLQQPSRGKVWIGGEELGPIGERRRRRLRRDVIGFIMQDHAIVPEWSVLRNLRVVRPEGVGRRALDVRIDEALNTVGLDGRQRQRAGLLSGGEQQRVGVARVLAQRPSVVLADEPTASLDDRSAARVRAGLDLIRARGGAVVVATHDPGLLEWSGREIDLGSEDSEPALMEGVRP